MPESPDFSVILKRDQDQAGFSLTEEIIPGFGYWTNDTNNAREFSIKVGSEEESASNTQAHRQDQQEKNPKGKEVACYQSMIQISYGEYKRVDQTTEGQGFQENGGAFSLRSLNERRKHPFRQKTRNDEQDDKEKIV